jgi:hypothetical protein
VRLDLGVDDAEVTAVQVPCVVTRLIDPAGEDVQGGPDGLDAQRRPSLRHSLIRRAG